jgi:DNA-binding transcriptional LysR family regulator
MRFTLRQLQVFTAVGRLANVTQAADLLAMSQSAASTALAELERQFGQPLFDRVGKRLRLNEIGRVAMPKALELLDRAAEMETILSGTAGPGILRLGASLTIGNYLGPGLIERYLALYPGAQVRLEVGNSSRIATRIAELELDLALIEGQISQSDLVTIDWRADQLAVFCGPGHRLASEKRASVERLLEEAWVVRESGSGTRQTLDRAMSPYWSQWQIRLELEHTEAIKSTVQAGQMIGCVSRMALKDAFQTGSLVEIAAPELDLGRRFYFLLNRQKYRTPGIDAFISVCRDATTED